MLFIIACALAFFLGLYISLHDLFSTTTMFFAFAKSSLALWGYGFIYGCLSVLFFCLLEDNFLNISIASTTAKPLSDEVKTWVFAVFAGISIKSLLNISFYNARIEGKTFPIGLATLVKIFEPQLLKSLETDHFIKFDSFLNYAVLKTSNLNLVDIHNVIRNTIDSRFTAPEVSGFLLELARTQSQKEALSLYMRAFGKKIFCYTFPQARPVR